MDGKLRHGFSEKQLKGVDVDAIYKAVFQVTPKDSMPESKANGIKTPKAIHQELPTVYTPGTQSPGTHTNGDLGEELSSASAQVDRHGASQYPADTVAPPLPATDNAVVPMAIIGMSCRFPGGANNIERFRELAFEGRSAWSKVPESRFNADAFYHPDSDRTDCMNVRAGHFLQGTDYTQFDAPFFNISPNEAKAIDPRGRMHLEGAYEALENAGITLSDVRGSDTAVFVGAFNSDYGDLIAHDPGMSPTYKATGLGVSLFSNRISHWFDLKGPSITMDTACSASMIALYMACECLRKGDSKMAIVSGSNLMLDPSYMLSLSTLKFLSPDGRTYMFDQRANGYSRGEGVATLIIKPLSEALSANDPIHAVVRHVRTNQDGRTPGITMPSQDAQRSLIQSTYQDVDLDPAETDFFEAHGTGTQAGDRVEAEALSSALCTASRPLHKPMFVGSVKTLIGHTEGCSGVAGVMHAVMALKSRVILPNSNFETPSDQIKFEEWRIKVPTKLQSWPTDHPRRASVNSFGYGGSNVHAILQEAPERRYQNMEADRTRNNSEAHLIQEQKIFCLSANDPGGIERQARCLAEYLQGHYDPAHMNDLAYTLGQRRSMLKYRFAVQSDSLEGLQSSLEKLKHDLPKASRFGRLAFIFTGQGAQWPKMGHELLTTYPVFQKAFQAADKHMNSLGATWSLQGMLDAPSLDCPALTRIVDELHRNAAESKVDEAFISQPLCTAVQIALVNLLRSWAVKPSIVMGHSSGEIAAAYTAGMLSLESAVSVAYYRGKVCSQLVSKDGAPKGAMLAAGLSAEDMQPYIAGITSGKAAIACINSPKSVTLSGDVRAINELHSRLEEKGLFSRKLKVNMAYHSTHMKPIAREYSTFLRDLSVQPRHPDVKFYSSVFPGISAETDAEYWVHNLLSPVRFSEAMQTILESQAAHDIACIEVGPHSALAGPFKQICESLPAELKTQYFPSMLRNENGVQQALKLACNLFNNHWDIDLASVNFPRGEAGLRVLTDLPPYAWNHNTKYWHEGRLAKNYRHRLNPPHELLGTLLDDSSELDMRWIKYIRQSQLPWLKDHIIKSECILPGAAYLSMAIEAVKQKASVIDRQVQGYTLRDVTFSKFLVVPNTTDGVEVSLSLVPFRQSSAAASTSWDEFRVISFGPDRKAYEHCHGLISVTYRPYFDLSSNDEAILARVCHDKAMTPELYNRWLSQRALKGNELGKSFQLISKSCLQNGDVFCTMCVPDTSGQDDPPTVSVPLIDTILQASFFSIADTTSALDGTIIPVSITELAISTTLSGGPGHVLQCRASTAELGPRDFDGRVIAAQDGDETLEPVIQAKGVMFVCIPQAEDGSKTNDAKTQLYWDISWKDDPDDLLQGDIVARWPAPKFEPQEITETVLCDRATWYCLRSAYESLTDGDDKIMASHHRKYYQWMKKRYELGQNGNLHFQKNGHQQEWASSDDQIIESTLKQAATASAQGRMTVRLGRRLLDVLRGEIDPLSLMLEDDLLNKFYAENRSQDRVYEQAARFAKLAAHKNPRLRVLEVGAGTGSATSWVLKALGGYGDSYPQFSSYVFTDISTGFFEKAQEKFKAWGSLVSYRSLNIEENLKAQGFDESEGYDIIVAANVLHATQNMDHTMAQVHKLLKPDGKLILVEATANSRILGPFCFGLLPGWWMGAAEGRTDSPLLSEGQWRSLLKRTGYSGLDICLRDSLNDDLWDMSMMVSTKDHGNASVDPCDTRIIYDPRQDLGLVDSLAKECERIFGTKPRISNLLETDPSEQLVVIVDRSSGSLLLDLDERGLSVLKAVFAQANCVLWITFGGVGNRSNAGAGAVSGLLRTLRSESGGMSFLTCDIENQDFSNPDFAQAISRIFAKVSYKSDIGSSVRDFEYAVQNGRIMIPRFVEDKIANKATMTAASQYEPEEQPLWQENNCLTLSMGQIGLLDTFQFIHSEGTSGEIGCEEVEIQVKAVGLNFLDLVIATGQLPGPKGFGVECAGIVAKLGKRTQNLKVGDKVCALASSSFSSHVRTPDCLVCLMPDNMSFEIAASIPGVFITAYYSLHYAARLQKNESILIHSAAGGTGQAMIKLAQRIGARIFVTAGSAAKVDFLEQSFGLPRSRILNSRNLDFGHQIMSLTEGKGVDVIVNSLAGDYLRESWRCLAMFGRFIELGKRDAVENGKLDMSKFEKSTSYISVGLNHFVEHRREYVGSLFKEVMELFGNGTLTPVSPITTFPMSAVEPAFRFMASGNHMGKIVVTADRGCLVKAIPRPLPPFRLRAEASYLIVGGLGGIGIEMAKWMVHKLGAKSLILISRSGMDATEATNAIEALKRPGVVVTVRKCDVTDMDSLSSVLHGCAHSLPPIRGVIQGAMVLKDAIFPNMTLTKYYQALNPKIRGSQNLHDFFQQSPDSLDFFVMLSSLGGILGNLSQSNYAAGNTFQDALAKHRASHGLPALTIDVGKVVDAGWVAANPDLVTRGVLAQSRDIRVKDLTNLIEHHVHGRGNGSDSIVAAQIAVGLEKYPVFDARFSHVGASLAGPLHKLEAQDQTQSLQSQIAAAGSDGARLVSTILEAFKQKLGRLLALKSEDVHEIETIAAHGVDSLVAVEIRNWFRKEVEVAPTMLEILSGRQSLRGLVEKIVEEKVKA